MSEATADLQSLSAKRDLWLATSRRLNFIYWTIGIIGLMMSALSTAKLEGLQSSYIPFTATICFGILGFANPQKRAVRNMQGYLIMDMAIFKYKAHLITVAQLYEELGRAETAVHGTGDVPAPVNHNLPQGTAANG